MFQVKRYDLITIWGIIFSLILIIAGNVSGNSKIYVWALLTVCVALFFYCFSDFYKKIGIALFYLCVFTFLTSSILIRYFTGKGDWMIGFGAREFNVGCNILYFAYIFIWLGSCFAERKKSKSTDNKIKHCYQFLIDDSYYSLKTIQKAAFCIMAVSALFALIFDMQKLVYVIQNGYLSIYTTYQETRWAERMRLISNAAFLLGIAAKPSKKMRNAFFFIAAINPVITLLEGARGGLVTFFLFTCFYYFNNPYMMEDTRNRAQEKRRLLKWGLILILIALIALPLLYNYAFIRAGDSVNVSRNPFLGILNFLDSQGGSFNIIGYSVQYRGQLPSKGYSLGSFIDWIQHNNFTGQTEERAVFAHDFACTISYVVEKYSYLAGYGMGSSYIAEVFYDFGIAGVMVANFFIGIMLQRLVDWGANSVFEQAVLFILFRNMLGMPRGAFSRPLDVLLSNSTILVFLLTFAISRKRKNKVMYNKKFNKEQCI